MRKNNATYQTFAALLIVGCAAYYFNSVNKDNAKVLKNINAKKSERSGFEAEVANAESAAGVFSRTRGLVSAYVDGVQTELVDGKWVDKGPLKDKTLVDSSVNHLFDAGAEKRLNELLDQTSTKLSEIHTITGAKDKVDIRDIEYSSTVWTTTFGALTGRPVTQSNATKALLALSQLGLPVRKIAFDRSKSTSGRFSVDVVLPVIPEVAETKLVIDSITNRFSPSSSLAEASPEKAREAYKFEPISATAEAKLIQLFGSYFKQDNDANSLGDRFQMDASRIEREKALKRAKDSAVASFKDSLQSTLADKIDYLADNLVVWDGIPIRNRETVCAALCQKYNIPEGTIVQIEGEQVSLSMHLQFDNGDSVPETIIISRAAKVNAALDELGAR